MKLSLSPLAFAHQPQSPLPTSAGSILPPSFVDLLSDLGCAVFRPELMTEIALLDANVGDNLFGFFRHLVQEIVDAR